MDAHETAEQLAQIREQMARLEGLVEGLRDAIRARAQETAQEAGQLRERVAKLEGLLREAKSGARIDRRRTGDRGAVIGGRDTNEPADPSVPELELHPADRHVQTLEELLEDRQGLMLYHHLPNLARGSDSSVDGRRSEACSSNSGCIERFSA